MKMQYAPMKLMTKWIFPRVSFIIRPVILGNQK